MKFEIVLFLCFLVSLIPFIAWCKKKDLENTKEQNERMERIYNTYGNSGVWKDCGDGTKMYFVDDVPIIGSLEML